MKNRIGVWLIWAALSVAPFSGVKAEKFSRWWDKIKSELYNSLNVNWLDVVELQWVKNFESMFPIDANVVMNAVLSYFDEEVKLYSLEWESREKVISTLSPYLEAHPVLVVWNQWRMKFVIEDKKEFCRVVKEIVNIIINDMPFFVRKVGIPLFFGWNDKFQEKLDNLENTVFTMKEKQYKDIVFDYIWWIVKRVAKTMDWKMSVKQYYDDMNKCFPNKNSDRISQEILRTWNWNVNIRYMKYPFKK